MSVNLSGGLKDLLLKTNCKTRHKGSHLRLGTPSGLFPSGLPTKALHALLLFCQEVGWGGGGWTRLI
jgi:hypothetical protein